MKGPLVQNIVESSIQKGRDFLHKKQESIISAAFLMAILLGITKIFGFLKLHLFARLFGASTALDVFWAAFTIPDMIFSVIVAGSVNAALIPVFAEKLMNPDAAKKIGRLFNEILNLFLWLFIVAGVLIFIFAPQLSRLLASGGLGGLGFEGGEFTTADVEMMALLTRIMVLSPVILSLSSVYTAGIQIHKRFFVTALAPLLYNLGIIFGAVVLSRFFETGAIGLAIGVVVGSALHFLVQIPVARRLGLSFRPTFKFWDADVVKVVKLAIPRVFGLIGEQLNVVVNTIIAIGLGSGALSAYRFASSLHLFPVQLIGSTIAQAALPAMSLEYHGDVGGKNTANEEFRRIFLKTFQQILFFTLPAVVFMVVLRLPIVRLLLGAGKFDWEDTTTTAWVLALFSLAIVGQAVISLVVRAYYAMQNTLAPVLISFIGLAFNIPVSILFTNFFSHYYNWRPLFESILNGARQLTPEVWAEIGRWFTTREASPAAVGGLALSVGFTLVIEITILLFNLNRKVKILGWKTMTQPTIKKLFSSAVMFFAMYSLYKLWNFSLDTSTVISIVGLFAFVGGMGILVYFGISVVIEVLEVNFFLELARKGIGKIKNVMQTQIIVEN